MSLGLWPEAVPFDPDSDTAIHDLRKHFDPAALPPAVVLVAARNLRDSKWAAQAACGLARAMAADRTVVLVDLDFDQPALHTIIGTANAEGVADALLFGASLERVTLRPAGEPFEFVPAGAFALEPEQLMAHPGWSRLLSELTTRNALLLAWAPLGASGLDEFAGRVNSVVILADDIDVTPTVAMLPETTRVEGVIKPPPPPAPPPPPPIPHEAAAEAVVESPVGSGVAAAPPVESAVAAAPPQGPPGDGGAGLFADRPRSPKDEAREALMAELRARQPDALPDHAMGLPPEADEEIASSRAGAGASASGGRLVRVAGLLVILAALAWFGGQLLAGGRKSAGALAPAGGEGEAQPAGDILGYSVAIESWDRLDDAMKRGDTLGQAQPGVQFYIVPIQLDSATFYRVMAGPMVDSAAADATMQGLVAQGLKTAATPGDVRSTPLAFEIGRYDLREDALNRMRVLKSQGIPSYVIEVPYTRGPSRFHVYSGAYAGPSEAEHMRRILRQAGIPDTLVLRVGRITP